MKKLDPFVRNVRQLLERREWAKAQALLRGFPTAVLELIERADDSFGVIGETFVARPTGSGLSLRFPRSGDLEF